MGTIIRDFADATIKELHVFADGTLGLDTNDGQLRQKGTGGSFSYAGGVVTATLTGAVLTAAHIGKLITIGNTISNGNSVSALITGVPAVDQITYANARGVTEAFTGSWSISSPKATLQAVFDLVPTFINHNTCIHLSGTFIPTTYAKFGPRTLGNNGTSGRYVIIDGGAGLTVFADNGGSPWVADIHSSSSIGLTTAGWVVDAYAGYMVEIVSGACAGQTRTIQGNTVDTITPTANWSGDPGLASFRIVRPTTTIQNYCMNLAGCTAGLFGYISLQRLYFTGAGYITLGFTSLMNVYLSHIVSNMNNLGYAAILGCSANAGTFLSHGWYNPDTFASYNGLTYSHCSVGFLSTSIVDSSGSFGTIRLTGVVSKGPVSISGVKSFALANGFRCFMGITISHIKTLGVSDISNTSGYATTKISNSAGVGLLADNSDVDAISGDISNCTSHGIEIRHGLLKFNGAVAGSGNVGAGVYAHDGSVVNIKHGSPPTLTGTVGNLAISDPAVEETTWAAIDAGTPVAIVAEMTMAKEVA